MFRHVLSLSLQGSFLWQRLDGRHTVRDLMLDYLGEFKAFAPQVVARSWAADAAGFVESRTLRADVAEAAFAFRHGNAACWWRAACWNGKSLSRYR